MTSMGKWSPSSSCDHTLYLKSMKYGGTLAFKATAILFSNATQTVLATVTHEPSRYPASQGGRWPHPQLAAEVVQAAVALPAASTGRPRDFLRMSMCPRKGPQFSCKDLKYGPLF